MDVGMKKVIFSREEGCDFHSVLKKRITHYFKDQQISPKANVSMLVKSIVLMGFAAMAYLMLLTGFGGIAGIFVFYALLGFFFASGTMSVAHDALHGAYLGNSPGNRMLGLLMDLFGASSFYWRKEHTVDHHTFTNIADHDADLDVPFLLRLCPKAEHHSFHRFQHWYAPFLYSMNLLRWIYFSDLKRIYHVFKDGQAGGVKPSKFEVFILISFKILHVFIFLVIPTLILPNPWWQVLLGYVGCLCTAGLVLTVIFQLAHIVENVAFPLPNNEGRMENSFAKHQLMTTSNFATKNRLVNFLFGGLNFQVEHHIFPHICHVHLRQISAIVQETAREFGLPYNENPSFFDALRSHFRTLKKLGVSPKRVEKPALNAP